MTERRGAHELRCFCSRKPLLAVYGIDQKGRLYVHVKVYKQSRIFGEMVFVGGEAHIRCRECLRWHVIVFVDRRKTAHLEESAEPKEILEDLVKVG